MARGYHLEARESVSNPIRVVYQIHRKLKMLQKTPVSNPIRVVYQMGSILPNFKTFTEVSNPIRVVYQILWRNIPRDRGEPFQTL